MSRREYRSSDTKRHRISGFDRAPSPKRSRRDGNVETGRARVDNESDKDRTGKDVKQHHRSRYEDLKPHETSLLNDESKVETGSVRKEVERENDVSDEGVRHATDPAKVSRPGSYFQHEDRAGAGQNGRSLDRREDRGRGWWRDPREHQTAHEEFKTTASNGQLKDEKTKEKKEDDRAWRHDGYFELEANPNRERRRLAFREHKVPSDPERTDKTASDHVTANPRVHNVRSGHKDYMARNRSFERDRGKNRTESWNGGRERYDGGNGRYSRGRDRDRDRFSGRAQSYRSNGNCAEKWKHDLYNEANRSPTPKNEENQIAKVEALLSS